MFKLSVFYALGLVSLAVAQEAFQVTVKPFSDSVSSIDDIGFSVIVTNPTDEDIRVISKSNILDDAPTRSFSVSKDGEEVHFTGIRVTYDFTQDSAYITIPASQSVDVNHTNLAALYDFESHGTGTFTFQPNVNFRTALDKPSINAKVQPVTVEVKDDVKARRLFDTGSVSTLDTTPVCNDAAKMSVLQAALSDAQGLAGAARDAVGGGSFGDFWGSNSQESVAERFDLIASDQGSRSIHCNEDPAGICSGGVVAYCMLALQGGQIVSSDIYNCDYFFDNIQETSALCNGPVGQVSNSLGGVTLHELSHATAATTDHVYGCQAVKDLSDTEKFENADNYQCFALTVFHQNNC